VPRLPRIARGERVYYGRPLVSTPSTESANRPLFTSPGTLPLSNTPSYDLHQHQENNFHRRWERCLLRKTSLWDILSSPSWQTPYLLFDVEKKNRNGYDLRDSARRVASPIGSCAADRVTQSRSRLGPRLLCYKYIQVRELSSLHRDVLRFPKVRSSATIADTLELWGSAPCVPFRSQLDGSRWSSVVPDWFTSILLYPMAMNCWALSPATRVIQSSLSQRTTTRR